MSIMGWQGNLGLINYRYFRIVASTLCKANTIWLYRVIISSVILDCLGFSLLRYVIGSESSQHIRLKCSLKVKKKKKRERSKTQHNTPKDTTLLRHNFVVVLTDDGLSLKYAGKIYYKCYCIMHYLQLCNLKNSYASRA